MGLYKDDHLHQIRQRVTLESLVSEATELVPDGPGRLKGCCPFHDEKTPSLKVNTEKQFYKCFGCDAKGDLFAFVMQWKGVTFYRAVQWLMERAGLALPKPDPKRHPQDRSFSTWYEYHDKKGDVVFLCGRKREKKQGFRYCIPQGNGQFDWKVPSEMFLLYRLPEVLKAKEERRTIYFVEGEKDADNLRRHFGFTATHYPTKPDQWTATNLEALRGADVVVIEDNDEAGRTWAQTALGLMYPVVRSVRHLSLEGLPEGGDVSDWIEAGHTRDELKALRDSTPYWIPPWSWDLVEEFRANGGVYRFGRSATLTVTKTDKDGNEEDIVYPLGRSIWPRERYHRLDDDSYGVRFLYRTQSGEQRHGTIESGAAVSEHAGGKACAEAATRGVQVAVRSKDRLAVALGYWAQARPRKEVSLVITPGWHGDAYVNGTKIFGAAHWYADETRNIIMQRSGRRGTAQAWASAVNEHVNTRGLQAALGISMAGPLVGLLRLKPFGIHLSGNSSHGKSTALTLSSSFWGNPTDIFQSWDNTDFSFEGMAQAANGGCLHLDEIIRFRGDDTKLSQTIHTVCSDTGRNRSKQGGDLAARKSWSNTVLSNGEVRVRDMLGDKLQGGHRVRLVDIWCEPGDLTTSEDHAVALEELSGEQYGCASDLWISYLVAPGRKRQIRETWEKYRVFANENWVNLLETNEDKRIAKNFALIATALEHASRVRLLNLTERQVRDVFRWLLEAAREANESHSAPKGPNERAYDLLMQWLATDPYRFPRVSDIKQARDVVAYQVTEDETATEPVYDLYTTRAMLNKSGLARLAAINVTKWMEWLEKKELGHRTSRGKRVGAMQKRWFVIKVGSLPECDECDESKTATSHEKPNDSIAM